MPTLQLDGFDIAEIDDVTADSLRHLVALHGLGQAAAEASFATAIGDPPEPQRERTIPKTINLLF
jgi:hypothetical protein